MRTTLPFWALVALLACLAGCGGASYDMASAGGMAAPAAPPAPPVDMASSAPAFERDSVMNAEEMTAKRELPESGTAAKDTPADARKPEPAGQPGAQGQPAGSRGGEVSAVRAPMLIYTAQITMAVFEVIPSINKVEALAKDLGGFLARRDDASIVIRVPVVRFDEAVKRIEGFGDMLHRNVVAEDVTEEFVDLEVRLRNARAIRDRLEKLLEKATKVEESVLLERELGRVASEIERIEGRMKFLRDRAAFSTITVSFQPRPAESINPSGPKLPVSWLNELGLGRLLNL